LQRLWFPYAKEGNTVLIELRLESGMQLFNSLDPTPFHSRDLDHDAEEYIAGSANEFPLKTPLKLVLWLPSAACADPRINDLGQAVRHYFQYRTWVAQRELRFVLWQGRLSLIIGLLFLFGCMSLIELLGALGEGTWIELFQEGLLIGGWVALWRPMEIFLYEWWPIYRSRAVYAKLGTIEVEMRPAGAE